MMAARRWYAASPKASSRLARYALASLFVLTAFVLTLAFQHLESDRPTLFLFFAAIVASAWFGGAGPGCYAVALSVPGGLYFYGATLSAVPIRLDDALLFVFFTLCAMAGGLLSSRQREAEESLQKTHGQLQAQALELQATNAALLAEMAERQRTEQALQETQTELAHAARLTTMGELAASIAHEINQPLAAVVTSAESCIRWLDAAEPSVARARNAASRIVRDGNRASEVIGRVRAMVRRAPPEKRPLDVNTTVADVLALARHELDKHRVSVRASFDPSLPRVEGDRVQLQQVLLNLFMNAIESLSSTDGPRALIVGSATRDGDAVVVVEDTGRGFEPGTIETLFDAFVTTKPDGMGLGLAICRSIVEAHGGSLTAFARAAGGARFELRLPSERARP